MQSLYRKVQLIKNIKDNWAFLSNVEAVKINKLALKSYYSIEFYGFFIFA